MQTTTNHTNGRQAGATGKTSLFLAIGFVAMLVGFTACADQPIDGGPDGTLRVDTTIVVRTDTILLEKTDTLFRTIRDTTFVTVRDTVREQVTRRDTIRDTVQVKVLDTIEVPVNRTVVRNARVIFPVTGDRNNAYDTVKFNASESLAYRIIDSAGAARGIGLTLAVGVPRTSRDHSLGLQSSTAYRLAGLTCIVPLHRVNFAVFPVYEIPLMRHPFSVLDVNTQVEGGISLRLFAPEQERNFELWTGQSFEADGTPGNDRFVNTGELRISEVDMRERRAIGVVTADFFIQDELGGRVNPIHLPVRIEFLFGW